MKAFWFERENSFYLGLQAVKFAISFVLRSGAVEIFISLHPKVDSIVHGDHYYSSSPSGFISFR